MGIHFQQHMHGDSGVRIMLFPDRWASYDGLPSPNIDLAPYYFPSIPPSVDSVFPLLLPLVSAQQGCLEPRRPPLFRTTLPALCERYTRATETQLSILLIITYKSRCS